MRASLMRTIEGRFLAGVQKEISRLLGRCEVSGKATVPLPFPVRIESLAVPAAVFHVMQLLFALLAAFFFLALVF